MNDLLAKIGNLSTSKKAALWVGTLLVVLYLFWMNFFSVARERQAELEEKITNFTTEIVNERRLARDLPKIKEAVKELEIKLKFALQELPDKKEIPELLSSVSTLAKDAGLEVSLFKPKAEELSEFYAKIPVSIQVEGTYHQVATFFDEVGQLSRIVNLSDIAFKDPLIEKGVNEVITNASCTATTFRYLDESERVQAPAEEEGKKKRRRKS